MPSRSSENEKFIDISRVLHGGMATYPGNPDFSVAPIRPALPGQSALSRIVLGSHTGTHIDAPAHIWADGLGTLAYPLEQLNGRCEVVYLPEVAQVITADHIPALSEERVLFRTSNSEQDGNVFDPAFIALDESAAEKLVSLGVRLVGIDALSIKKKGVQDQVHQIFLQAGTIILEGLWLAKVVPGPYDLMCLPLATDGDGAPARAVLRVINE